jgi:hypothetical protein
MPLVPGDRLRRRGLAALLAGGLLTVAASFGLPAFAQSQAQTLEYPIKAAFLFKFGEFVQWPPDAFAASSGVLNICVVGDTAFATTVATAVQNETVAGRPVLTQALSSISASDPCHIAYIAGSAKQPVAEALSVVAGRPMLTVTDGARGPSTGIIHFVVLNNRVRFAIDDNAAAANGLTLSSALLNIAVSVQRRN